MIAPNHVGPRTLRSIPVLRTILCCLVLSTFIAAAVPLCPGTLDAAAIALPAPVTEHPDSADAEPAGGGLESGCAGSGTAAEDCCATWVVPVGLAAQARAGTPDVRLAGPITGTSLPPLPDAPRGPSSSRTPTLIELSVSRT